MIKAFMNWSGGKDSALGFYKAINNGIAIEALVTTISNGRVSMHGLRKDLVEAQARAMGLPVYFIEPGIAPGMNAYEEAIHASNQEMLTQGFTHVVSGDLFLQDLRQYREELYARDGIKTLFPLWSIPPATILKDLFESGFKAKVITINGEMLEKEMCGRELDLSFVNDLPASVDICGENGEYHSFIYDGPIFKNKIDFIAGEVVSRSYPRPAGGDKECFGALQKEMVFFFQELLPPDL
jgi:uncharacterized protein (TIGR00290 family)